MSVEMLATRAVGCLAGSAVGDALGGATEGWESQRDPQPLRRLGRGHRPVDASPAGRRQAVLALLEGRRARHRRHLDDARPRAGLRRQARPPRRVRPRGARRAADRRRADLDSRARPRGSALSPALPRREVAGAQAPLRPRRTRGTPGSATSSTAAPRCTSLRSASPTRAIPTARISRRSTSRQRHQSSYGREAAGVLAAAVAEAMRPGATPESVVDGRHPPCQGRRRGPRSRRSPRLLPGSTVGATGAWRRSGPRSRRSTRSASTTRHRLRTPAPRAASGRSRRCRSRSGCSRDRRRLPRDDARRRQLRPRLRLDRLDGRLARRSSRLDGARRSWIEEIGTASRLDLEEPGRDHGRRGRRDPRHETGSASKPAPAR